MTSRKHDEPVDLSLREALRVARTLRDEGALEVDVSVDGARVRARFSGTPRMLADDPEPAPLTDEERARLDEERAKAAEERMYWSAD